MNMKDNQTLYIVHAIKDHQVLSKTCSQDLNDFEDYDLAVKNLLQEEKTEAITKDDITYVVETIKPQPVVYIFGGGTVALPLSHLCKLCGFKVVVFDDREEFANKERFKEADDVICEDMAKSLENYPFDDHAYFVIVTRGHLGDKECLEALLHKKYTYLGMIGSKRKSQLLFNYLLENGYDQCQLDSVHAPIGLDIKAQTPEEIAVSILAEMIAVKNDKTIQECDLELFNHIQEPCVLCSLILSKGSTPRKMGCKMIVYEDGLIYNTIGGGTLEYETIKKAKQMFSGDETYAFLDFELSNTQAAKAGMVCGGKQQVLLEKIVK